MYQVLTRETLKVIE